MGKANTLKKCADALEELVEDIERELKKRIQMRKDKDAPAQHVES